jgi:hypothetical protein
MDTWYQVEICDPSALSGDSVVRLLTELATLLPVARVVVSRAEGSGPGFNALFPELMELDVPTIVSHAQQVTQFDWADFFLVDTPGAVADVSPSGDYREILPRTLATVRAVDDTYFYLYTRDRATAETVARTHIGAKIDARRIEDLDFAD